MKALMAFCCLAGCAAAHGRIEGPPLYVHLCDAMPAQDRETWGAAAGELNEELGELALFVGHGPTRRCNTVDVCPSDTPAPTRIGTCEITVRYAHGSAAEVARRELESLL